MFHVEHLVMFYVEHKEDTMRNILILLNPTAGSKKQLNRLNLLEKQLEENGIKFSIDKTLYPKYIIEKYKDNYDLPYTDVISCGGDGTLFEVVNAFHDKNVTISLFPIGTANDYYRIFTDSEDIDYLGLIIRIIEQKSRKVDVIKVNDNYTINNAGFGLDTKTLTIRNKLTPVLYGKLAYKAAALRAISSYKAENIKIIVDGQEYERKVMITTLSAGMYFGGGMMINPLAVVDDGKAELFILNECGRLKLLGLFKKIFLGTHLEEELVEVFQGTKFTIIPEHSRVMHSEGELMDFEEIHAEVLNNYIDLIV